MNYQEIQEALAAVARLSEELETQYIENDGEVTQEAEAIEAELSALKALLQGEGIDELGRWLKAKEDQLATFKAEKAAADRRVKSVQNSIDFVKAKIREVMDMTGTEKAKGSYYGFTATVSERSSVDTEELDRLYLDVATSAAHDAGLPAYVDVVLKTTTTALKEWGATDLLETTRTDTVRFTKPRRSE